jgi:hypothetical protein
LSIWELPHHIRSDGRDARNQVNSARRAAEALFTPKSPPTAKQTVTGSAADQLIRKPRVLAAKRATLLRDSREAALVSSQATSHPVPVTHIPRIRTWLDYGMTLAQVARVYGVSIRVIEGLL